ncbi:MAG: tail fiber domain-containing protein [Salibacteraceae bacterium]
MRKYARIVAIMALAVGFGVSTASAQTLFLPGGAALGSGGIGVDANPAFAPFDVVGNNMLLRPSNTFNPNGKFIGIGESGGIVGPINGCDIYGFRAQRNQSSFINVGIRKFSFTPVNPGDPIPVPLIDNFPTISWGSTATLPIFPNPTQIPKSLEFRFDNSNTSCGELIATMSGLSSTYQFTIRGSGLASGGMWVNSDARYKQNIQTIGNAMDLIGQLRGTTYTMDRENFPDRNFNEGLQYGFIAQELQEVMPTMVKEDQDGYLAVNYDAMVPVLVEGMKEQQDQLEVQKATIDEQNAVIENQNADLNAAKLANEELTNQVQEQQAVLEQQDLAIRQLQQDMMALQNNLQPVKNGTSASSGETSQLFQNRPNPFRESTEIHFYLPTDVEQATLVVYSLDGKELMSFNNLDRGYGNVLVEAGQLMPGNYVYRLIADNEVVDSKTLVLSK